MNSAFDQIEFLLNDELVVLKDVNPNTTVLSYLRDSAGKIGTKEGCASGDCGACTVVLAEPNGNKLRYSTINSCISMIQAVNGKQVLTIEALKSDNGLHNVQTAMVENHGSQCGFCTPGFVMSLFALKKNALEKSEKGDEGIGANMEEIEEALSGNLCRCTGYRSIVDAAKQSFESDEKDQFQRSETEIIQRLKDISGDQQTFSPQKIEELTDLLLAYPKATMLAGGTDLGLLITQNLVQFDVVIYLGKVKGLQILEVAEDQINIGAGVSYTQSHSIIKNEYPDWGRMMTRLGSLQIRNLGTIGGNIGNASPIADMPPVLIALNASITLQLGKQEREIPVEDYYIDYKVTCQQESEFIRTIHIPRSNPDYELKIYKISKRFDDDISAVLGVFNVKLVDGVVSDVSIAFGGMAAIPKRAVNSELALKGQPWNQETIDKAKLALATDYSPLSDMRASADYRMTVAQNLLQKCYLELSQPDLNVNVLSFEAKAVDRDA